MKNFFGLFLLIISFTVSARELESSNTEANLQSARSHIQDAAYDIEEAAIGVQCAETSLNNIESQAGCVADCRCAGMKKVFRQGKARGILVKASDIYPCDVNDGWVNDQVDFCARTSQGVIRARTQKSFLGDCE